MRSRRRRSAPKPCDCCPTRRSGLGLTLRRSASTRVHLPMRILGFLLALLVLAPTLSASVVLPAEFTEIVAGSQIIVYGRVSEVRPEWTDGRRRIESLVTVEASSFLRGTPTATVTFRVPGGQIGRLKSVTAGA